MSKSESFQIELKLKVKPVKSAKCFMGPSVLSSVNYLFTPQKNKLLKLFF